MTSVESCDTGRPPSPSAPGHRPWIAALLLICPWFATGCEQAPPAEPEHLLVITIDTLRADRLGYHGNPRDVSPTLDGLARGGARFLQATAPTSCTAPSHSSLFTGLYPLTHGLTNNFYQLRTDVETLAELLGARGFRTAGFYHVFPFHKSRIVQGFQHTYHDESQRGTGLLTEVEGWLRERRDEPNLFAWVHLFMPHAPNDPPEEFSHWIEQAYDGPLGQDHKTLEAIRSGAVEPPQEYLQNYRDGYDAEVAYVDHCVARILEMYEGFGLRDNTVIVVVADHGEALEDETIGLHAPIIEQSTLHVPLFLNGPGIPSVEVTEVVELIDVFPTVLEIFDQVPGAGCQGRSLRPLMEGRVDAWEGMAFSMLPTEYLGQGVGRNKEPPAVAVRSGPWKLVLRGREEVELYHLEDDPGETTNRAADEERQVRVLKNALEQWVADVRREYDSGQPLDEAAREFLEALGYTAGE